MSETLYNVPVPPKKHSGGRKIKYDLADIGVGGFKHFENAKVGTIRVSLYHFKIKSIIPADWKFTIRNYSHEGKEGVGVWRIA